jgi:hypothetical protein
MEATRQAPAGDPFTIRLARDIDPERFDRANRVAFVVIAALYITLRLWRLTHYGLYGDETFSLHLARGDWSALIDQAVADVVHPPLFYLLLKLWILIGGESLLWLKLLPVLTSIAAIIPFVLLCRELRVRPLVINIALALSAVNAYLVFHSQELRMYSLLAALALTSVWLFVKLVNSDAQRGKLQVALFVVNLLLVYTQFYGWAIVGIELLFLLLLRRDRLGLFSIGVAALVALSAPWVYMVAQAAISKGGLEANLGWNRAPDVLKFAYFYKTVTGGLSEQFSKLGSFYQFLIILYRFLLPISLIPIALWVAEALRNRRRERAYSLWFLAALSCLPAMASFIASQWLPQSVWEVRYLIISVPASIILLSLSFDRLRRQRVRAFSISLLLGWAALTGFIETERRDRVAIEPIARQLIEAEPAGDHTTKVYTNRGGENVNVANTLQFYLEELNERMFRVDYVRDYTEPEEDNFWVIFMKYVPEDRLRVERELAPRGYLFGEPLITRAVTYEIVLLPVTRPAR